MPFVKSAPGRPHCDPDLDPNPFGKGVIPKRGRAPANGEKYTWADDAEVADLTNHRTSRRGVVVTCRGMAWDRSTAPGRDAAAFRAAKDSPERRRKPCERPAARNADGFPLEFCREHLPAKGEALKASAIVAGASKRTRHGLYAEIVEMQLDAALARNADPELRREALADMAVMQAADVDDPSALLANAIKKVTARIERIQRKYFAGELDDADYANGLVQLSEVLRKLTHTRHGMLGTADEAQDQAMSEALRELGLEGDDVEEIVPDDVIDVEAVVTTPDPTHFPRADTDEGGDDGEPEVVEFRADGRLRE